MDKGGRGVPRHHTGQYNISRLCRYVVTQPLLQMTAVRHLRLISGVSLKMSFQGSRADEPHEADGTAERPFSRVNSHVSLQRCCLSELFVTQNTVVRSVTCK